MALLPRVSDEKGPVKNMRIMSITNAGEDGVAQDKTSSIYIECKSEDSKSAPECNITIIKGVIPG